MVSIEEIEERIVQLHKEGKGTRVIGADVHKNFSFVSAVLRKRFPEEYPDTSTTTKETQALKAFHVGKSPTEVAIELGLPTEETEKYYKNFWRLERLYELYRIYNENKTRLGLFLDFYKQLEKRKIISRKDFKDILKIVDTNNALGEEMEDFDTNFVEGGHPKRDLKHKDIFLRNHEALLPDEHIYSADELERAFYET